MKKNVVRILTAMLMFSMIFSSSVFAAEKTTAWDSFVGLFAGSAKTAEDTQVGGITYRTHIQNEGWAQGWVEDGAMSGSVGKGLRLEGIEIKLQGDQLPEGLGITYRTHIQNEGWAQGWVEEGEMSGSEGKGLRLEGIEIKLTGDNAADYSVEYQTQIENEGWAQGWVKDGEMSGSSGKGLRLEAIEIKVVQVEADLTAYTAALDAVDEADYTPASWAAYQEVVLANVMTTADLQSEVDAATEAIVAAQNNLVELGKVTGLVAINATTVEVTLSEAVTEIDKADFTVEGLAVANAAIKQTDNKVVVLTTATQVGGQVYKVSYQGVDTGLTFTGISAVLPTAISLEQGTNFVVVGQEFTVKATVTTADANKAGIPVTFNIKSPAGSLNQNIIAERYTDANGVAEYKYTRYATDDDTIAVYPTGAASVRATRTLSWTAQDRLAVATSDVNVIANNSNKTYTVTVRNQNTGAVVAGQQVKVLFSENVAAVNGSSASVTDPSTGTTVVAPAQRATGDNTALALTTNTNGTATFTITGANTKATPIIYMESVGGQANRLDAQDIQVWGAQVTFQGAQLTNQITVTPDTDANIANSTTSGRVYTVEVKKADGTVFAGGRVQIGFNELVDNNLGTTTAANFIWFDNDSSLRTTGTTSATLPSGVQAANLAPWKSVGVINQMEIALNADGKATFQVADNVPADVATPIVWIDLDSTVTLGNNHVLETTEPSKLGGKMIIEGQVVTAGKLDVNNSTLSAGQTAVLTYSVRDQNGAAFLPLVDPAAAPTTGNVRVTYSIANTGTNPLTVTPVAGDSVLAGSWSINGGANGAFPGLTLNAGANATVAVTLENSSLTTRSTQTLLGLTTAAGAGTSYSISAQGLTLGTNISLPTATITGNFVNAVSVDTIGVAGDNVTGTITAFDTADADYIGLPTAGPGQEQSGRVIVSVDGQPGVYAWFTYTQALGAPVVPGIGLSLNDSLYVGSDSAYTSNSAATNAQFESALSVGNKVRFTKASNATHRTVIDTINMYNANATNVNSQINQTLPAVVPPVLANYVTDNDNEGVAVAETLGRTLVPAVAGTTQFTVTGVAPGTDTYTISTTTTNANTANNNVVVSVTVNATDSLDVTGTETALNIRLANVNALSAKNTAALIQAAVRAVGTQGTTDYTQWTVTGATAALAPVSIGNATSNIAGASTIVTAVPGVNTFTLNRVMTAGQTLTINYNGTNYNFVAGTDFALGSSLATQAANIVTAINARAGLGGAVNTAALVALPSTHAISLTQATGTTTSGPTTVTTNPVV